ncbi:MAG TPA: xanthine dehydrogenase family protein subunit M [Chitinophagaceae bacterium]|nr:xanthine dehydrogenase family protein subunit M [Chitinophagaceae bacterium]
MVPVSFGYKKVKSVEEAISEMASSGGTILAGGHSLIPALKLRLSQPSELIDINGIESLKSIREQNGAIVIGSRATHAQVAGDALIQKYFPMMVTGASLIGDRQVRNYGTIGGSLAHADPAADWPAMVLASDSTIEVHGTAGSRLIHSSNFFKGLFHTDLQENEIITAIHVPIPPAGTKSSYQKFIQPASRFAIVGCAVESLPDKKVRIAFTGVSDYAFRDQGAEAALEGNNIDDQSIDNAVNAALKGVRIASDHYASVEYRTHLAQVYLRKALVAVK